MEKENRPCFSEMLAKNILIRQQALEVSAMLENVGVETILLKGVALMEISPAYSFEREVEDIDLLIKPGRLAAAVRVLESAGCSRLPEDPFAFTRAGWSVPVDLCEGLWYLTNAQNEKVFEQAVNTGNFRVLPPEEFFIHIKAHSLFHHARKENKWERDIQVLTTEFKDKIDLAAVEKKLAARGFDSGERLPCSASFAGLLSQNFKERLLEMFIKNEIPQKGHLTRFLFLPAAMKIRYALKLFFPSSDFIRGRYNIKSVLGVAVYRFLRPLMLLKEFFKAAAVFTVSRGEGEKC